MAQKQKGAKNKSSKSKTLRFKANINLLRNLNVVVLIAGFVASLCTLTFLSSRSHTYDIRSRANVTVPSPTPTCPQDSCLTPFPSPSVTPAKAK